MKGKRLADTPIGQFPVDYDDLEPGDYWKVLHRHEDRPLDVINHPEDRRWWGNASSDKWAGNLTGGVWGLITPLKQYAMLSIHTVREEDDGTISVRAGDGSSNSILVKGAEGTWHGYIEHGEWSEC
jgi:hypothetical protein